MNKELLLDESRRIGRDIVKLVNEYRTSTGENTNLDEKYFADYFAGIVAWLSTGQGQAVIECDSIEDENNRLYVEGSLTIRDKTRYPFSENNINDFLSMAQSFVREDGDMKSSYLWSMDPITFLYFLMGTNYQGRQLFDGSKEEVGFGG